MLVEEGVLRLEPAVLEPGERPYVTMQAWLDHAGRDDLIDCVADEFERPVIAAGAPLWTANYR